MIDRRMFLASAVGGLFAVPSLVRAAEPDGYKIWRYIARSEIIVVGTLRPPPGLFDTRTGYWTIPVSEIKVLIGEAPSPLMLMHSSIPSGVLDNEAVPSFANRPAVLFIETGDQGACHLVAFDGLVDATQANLSHVSAEIALQRLQSMEWTPNSAFPYSAEVRSIISRIASIKPSDPRDEVARQVQETAFRDLEALGQPAFLAIVDQMDDRRPLPFPQLSLANTSPSAFEDLRHYGPKVMSTRSLRS